MGSEYTTDFENKALGLHYCSGGAGYVISRRAAEALSACKHEHAYEDVQTGWCLRDAGYSVHHHHGFIGVDLSTSLKYWLRSSEWDNYHKEKHVPAALISLHGYKNSYAFVGLDILTRARTVSSLRRRVSKPSEVPLEVNGVDVRAAFDVCCAP
jgi:hypothetical protein